MIKSLCKYRRIEIAAQIAAITRIVSAPDYICISCARVANDKAYLCKPSSISPKSLKLADVRPVKVMEEPAIHSLVAVNLHTRDWSKLGKKESRKLKKLEKKKAKKIKKANKALMRYYAALKKAGVEN